ncbi:MAG: type III pantothenate kinase [Bacteroidota bacterium]|nr:type III pantothenate kinase [Bacteroidota bacterium]
MNLVLDFGNTSIKAAVFNKNELIKSYIFNSDEELTDFILNQNNINNSIICSVTNQHHLILEKLPKKIEALIYSSNTKIPLKNLYKSISTLGSDRIAASVGSYTLFPNKNVLTIDAGTCIKYNFVNADNEYLGGAISPGLNMRLKALNHFTHALPLIEFDKNYEKLTGETTQESILSGALIGAVCEVKSMIEQYHALYKDLQIVITGGNANYLSKQLKSRFFTNQNILLYGLNSILNYNL